MFKYFGIGLVVLAAAIAVIPHYTDCQSQGKMMTLVSGMKAPMVCHYTGLAEIGAGIPLAAVGIMMVTSRRKESLTYLSITSIALAGVVLALPNFIIGTCPSPTDICNTAMKPSLDALGGLTGIVGAVGLVSAWRGKGLT